jgi:hypothetical protein
MRSERSPSGAGPGVALAPNYKVRVIGRGTMICRAMSDNRPLDYVRRRQGFRFSGIGANFFGNWTWDLE